MGIRGQQDLSCFNLTGEDPNPRLWAFLIACYWVSLVSLFLLWRAYKHVAWLRTEALKSPDVKPEQFVVVERDIPPVPEGQTGKEQVDSYFKAIYPETFYRSMIITDNKKVNKIWEELEGYKKKLAVQKVTLTEKQQDAALIFFSNRVVAASAAQSLNL